MGTVTGDFDVFANWIGRGSELADLLRRSVSEQQNAGYFHTLREICQQPETWTATAATIAGRRVELASLLEPCRAMTLAGSGSSQYCGDCLAPALQNELRISAESTSSGWLLMDPGLDVPSVPCVMVSLARSGDSPESCGAVERVIEHRPDVRHLVLTCNAAGRLSQMYGNHPLVTVIALDDATNDRSLVMTSSFTNMVIAGRFLGMLGQTREYRALVDNLADAARVLIGGHSNGLATIARGCFKRAVFLGSGCRYGSAREAALKMLEMTAGRVFTMAETYLGLRHGPMSAIHPDTLVVCFLASDPMMRAYECDLIRELTAKGLGWRKVILGENIPADLIAPTDVALECPGMSTAGDQNATVLDVIAGQLLAFFRCMTEGLKPDSPSDANVISRVVNDFTLYRPEDGI
jgi:tagatose-6-phosphate ketose/aldose isomerase